MRARATAFYEELVGRRTVRDFAADPVPIDVLDTAIATASSAPSGAHKQPWTFVVVTDPAVKATIREAAEVEERAFYQGRAGERWLKDLEPFETNADKPFLETAPALIAVFAQKHGGADGERHYYVSESVGIATGFLIAALHHAGLAALVHTPSPMRFLGEILGRPRNERPYLLLVVGYPAVGATVPDLARKELDEVRVLVAEDS